MSNGMEREFQAFQNTDRELWREREDDYYADSIHVTQGGNIGINCGGRVIVMPIRKWHEVALRAASETRGCTYPACDCAMAWTGEGPVPETVCPRGESAATLHPEAVVKESLTPHSDHQMRVWDRTCPACNPEAEAREFLSKEKVAELWQRAMRESERRFVGFLRRGFAPDFNDPSTLTLPDVFAILIQEELALRSGGDAERMDWLDRVGAEFGHGFLQLGNGDYEFYVHRHHNGQKYPSAREVIDAALARNPEGKAPPTGSQNTGGADV